MFKNYYSKTIANEQVQLINVGYGYELVILSIEISGSDTSGTLELRKYDNTTLAFSQQLSVGINEPIVLSHKILLPTGFKYSIFSSVSNIQVCINAVIETNELTENESFSSDTTSNY